MSKLAVIRVRGRAGVNRRIESAMHILKIYNKYHCIVVDNNKEIIGMLKKIKDYTTWGEIDKATLTKLLDERGKLPGNKKLDNAYIKEKINVDIQGFAEQLYEGKRNLKDVPGLKSFFKLRPPLRGFERGGIKKPFSMGGVLGYRKDKINSLLQRMI
ncbi:50S ribosomal protein L30 [Candidatus Woesearchaeota archaeon]|nr:50S ribosomal protein L30 [Candidatus Woesearchaeota archaeon]